MSPEEYRAAEEISNDMDKARKDELFIAFEKDFAELEKLAHEQLPLKHQGIHGEAAVGMTPGETLASHEHIKTQEEQDAETVAQIEEESKTFVPADAEASMMPEAEKAKAAEKLYVDEMRAAAQMTAMHEKDRDALRELVLSQRDEYLAMKERGEVAFTEVIDFYDRAILAIKEFIEQHNLGQ